MEVRDFAHGLVTTEDLVRKLGAPPAGLTDEELGAPLRLERPGRPPALRFQRRIEVPPSEGMPDPAQRSRILHALANHELQAAELFAWALLAFPDAPKDFRQGLLRILADEQRHTRMYIARVEDAGARFGDYPVNGYFWSKIESITTPLRFLCAMSLTFENANLDHTQEYEEAARRAGDAKTAAVIERVHLDEIEHVRFGWTWLQIFKQEDESAWDAYRANLTWPLRPAKARGRIFHREGREAAGLEAEFIRRLEEEGG
ncbi:MAG: DUF455 domain-containing protein [Acidobacteria bacterium]|nr:MAG: DUF455 domain-containing protein [Acidobacteriota bacterium]